MSFTSRKLRHSKKRKSKLTALLTLGLAVFGSLFVILIIYELFLANNAGKQKEDQVDAITANEEVAVVAPVGNSGEPIGMGQNEPAANPISTKPVSTEPVNQAAVVQAPTVAIPMAAATPPSSAVSPAITQSSQSSQKSSTKKAEPAQAAAKPKAVKHVVQKGETLIQLSRKYYGNQRSINKIAAYNNINPNAALPIGKVLYIPVAR
ncbi:MAG: LysM peptidoglycan-binding domain-containing protein [Clostridia bacterium]